MTEEKPPLLEFAQAAQKIENPRGPFKHYQNKEFKEGDKVSGTWVDLDGTTHFQEGIIVFYEATGLWVQSQSNGGITQVKRFWTLIHQK
jgi:hypothetical protein